MSLSIAGPRSKTSEPDVMPGSPILEDLTTATLVLGQIEGNGNKWRRRPTFDHGDHCADIHPLPSTHGDACRRVTRFPTTSGDRSLGPPSSEGQNRQELRERE
jgi:hypothetical protein